jgi:serine acetyltransferase
MDEETYVFDSVSDGADGVPLHDATPRTIHSYLERNDQETYSVMTSTRTYASSLFNSSLQAGYKHIVNHHLVPNLIPPSRPALNKLLETTGITIDQRTTSEYCSVAPGVQFDSILPELISVGDCVQIGTDAKIAAHANLGTRPVKENGVWTGAHWRIGPVTIGDYVDIGSEAILGPSTTIGDNSQVCMRTTTYEQTIPPNHQLRNKTTSNSLRPRKQRRVTSTGATPLIKTKTKI